MAGQGGPDDETWKKMSRNEKRVYWCAVIFVATLVGGGFLKLLLD